VNNNKKFKLSPTVLIGAILPFLIDFKQLYCQPLKPYFKDFISWLEILDCNILISMPYLNYFY